MPDFQLSEAEAVQLADFLSAQAGSAREFEPAKLSAFSSGKAESLLVEKLSCLGCHRLGERGGRIGPDLGQVRGRLHGDYVYQIIKDPRSIAPHAVMPRIGMPDKTIRLLANYLLHQERPPRNASYLSLVDNGLTFVDPLPGSTMDAKRNYLTYCAACHGTEGRGDGFNARFLAARPTIHADAGYMSTRPDDTLYDGIHSGGYILNKSQLMPPWGQSLPAPAIRDLVKHLRALCQCQGPSWAVDNESAERLKR